MNKILLALFFSLTFFFNSSLACENIGFPKWIDFHFSVNIKVIKSLNLMNLLPSTEGFKTKMNELAINASFDYFRDVSIIQIIGTIPISGEISRGAIIHYGKFYEEKIIPFLKTKLGDPVEERFCGKTIYLSTDRNKALVFFGKNIMVLGYVELIKALIVRNYLGFPFKNYFSYLFIQCSNKVLSLSIFHPYKLVCSLLNLRSRELRQKQK